MNEKNTKQSQKPKTSILAFASLVCVIISTCLSILLVCVHLLILKGRVVKNFDMTMLSIVQAASFMGLIFGLAALIHIWKSNVPLAGKRWAIIAILFPIIMSLTIFPIFAPWQPPRELICQVHIRNLRTAIIVYSEKNSGRLPKSDTWCDLLMPYIDNPDESFVCPETENERCSYSFNMNVSGMLLDEIPPNVVLLFESGPSWNSVGGPELLNVSNHDEKGCNVSFANGQQEFVRTEDLDTLRWKP